MTQTEKREDSSFFGPYVDAIFELDIFVELAWAGLDYGTAATRVAEVLREAAIRGNQPNTDEELYKEKLRHAKKLEQFGIKQAERNFPFLYSLAVIRFMDNS